MTVENTNPIQHFTANGTDVSFAFNFAVEGKDNIQVKINDYVIYDVEYRYDPVNNAVEFYSAPQEGDYITVERVTSLDRSVNYKTYDNSFRPETLNYDMDRIWRVLQEQHIVDAEILSSVKREIDWRRDNDNLLQHQIDLLNDVTLGVFNKASNEYLEDKLKELSDTIDVAAAAGAGANGWTDQLVQTWSGRSQQDKNKERVSVKDFGAIGDGTLHTLQEWIDSGKFNNLTAIQVIYPHATSLTDAIDWVACQAAIDFVGKGGTVYFNQTSVNNYIINKPLKFYGGQSWLGCGGVDVAASTGKGTRITLVALATSVAEPKNPTVVTYSFNPVGIYFNAQSYGDAGLSLYNTSYAKVDHCAATVSKEGAAAFLLDSDTSKQCYFNILTACRGFAQGTGCVGVRFTRGANANQVIGGKFGSSVRAMEFLSLSSGNLILGTDFEDNSDRHIYVDAPNNVFIGTHMETAPIGFDITANGTNTQRMNTTYATNTIVNVQDASKIGTVLDTRSETSGMKGDLRFGPARFFSEYYSGTSRNDFDLDLASNTSNALFRLFSNTNTTGQRRLTLYKGDGTSKQSIVLDAATSEITVGDLIQENGNGGIYRKMIRRPNIPSTGTYSEGDTVNRTNPTATAPVTQWTCVTGGTSGTWQASAWVVSKGATASRPTLTANDIGVQYFDTTLAAAAGKPIWWTGSAWVDATGVAV